MPRIFPVIECDCTGEGFWLPLPPQPWPRFVELSGATTPAHVALVLLVLSTYGRRSAGMAVSAAELRRDFPIIAAGGLAVSDGVTTVFPGCCCGLEGWREWERFLDSGMSPWLGHDPAPFVEQDGSTITVWADGDVSHLDREATGRVIMQRDDAVIAIAEIATSLAGFAGRIEAVLRDHCLPEARAIAASFRATFEVGEQ